MATLDAAVAARDKVASCLDDSDDISSVGIVRVSEGFGLRVNLRVRGASVPPEVDGVPVSTRVSGKVRAH